jgi:amidase
MAYESMFALLTRHGYTGEDAYVGMSAVAHTELGGPTGSVAPDPLDRFARSVPSPSPGSARTS